MTITCDIHGGELKYRFDKCWWECVGWDGEGCCHLTDEDVCELMSGGPLPETCEALGVTWQRRGAKLSGDIEWIRVKVSAKSHEELERHYRPIATNETGTMTTWQELDD
jgi:hypothetical protein